MQGVPCFTCERARSQTDFHYCHLASFDPFKGVLEFQKVTNDTLLCLHVDETAGLVSKSPNTHINLRFLY